MSAINRQNVVCECVIGNFVYVNLNCFVEDNSSTVFDDIPGVNDTKSKVGSDCKSPVGDEDITETTDNDDDIDNLDLDAEWSEASGKILILIIHTEELARFFATKR